MIRVTYIGGLGNNLFQYCFGRVLACHTGYALEAAPIRGFAHTAEQIEGLDCSDCPELELTGHVVDFKSLTTSRQRVMILANGFFQRYEYYQDYANAIRNHWLVPDSWIVSAASSILGGRPDKQDVVVHVRNQDESPQHHELGFSYYRRALESANPKRVFVCTDAPEHDFLEHFEPWHPRVVRGNDELVDLQFMRSFNKIICSQSTYAWWAGLLSEAEEIYYPEPLRGCAARSDIDYHVDEPQYRYIREDPA